MLRTSLRIVDSPDVAGRDQFLSSNAQDFIEESHAVVVFNFGVLFLSSNAQDFIEDGQKRGHVGEGLKIPEQ